MRLTERITTTIRLPCELMERLRRQADVMGLSVNQLILVLIDKGFQCLQ